MILEVLSNQNDPDSVTVSQAHVPYGHDQKVILLSSDQEISLEFWGNSELLHLTVFVVFQ